MTTTLAPTSIAEQETLIRFLRSVFTGPAKMNSFDPELIAWKYFSSHPEWDGARSFVAKADGNIVGHAGVWPVSLWHSGAPLKAVHLIDWAAARAQPGLGVLLLRKLAAMADLLLTIGGSAETQAILPKLGYRRCGAVAIQVKLVHPVRQITRKYQWNWKTPARVLRNAIWAVGGLPAAPPGWQVSQVRAFEESITELLSPNASSGAVRTIAGINHLLTCPAAKFTAYVISDAKKMRGYFVLSQHVGQVRIVDLAATAGDQDALIATCAAAARTAAAMPGCREVVAGFSSEELQRIFADMGFRTRQLAPVFCYDPRNILISKYRPKLSMSDGDLCFLFNAEQPYLT